MEEIKFYGRYQDKYFLTSIMDGDDTTVEVTLPCHLRETSDCHDGAAWPVLRHQVSRASSGGDDDD